MSDECQWAFFPTFEVSELWTFPTISRSPTSGASPRDVCPRDDDSGSAGADSSLPDDVSSDLNGGGSTDESDNADGQLAASRACGQSRSGEQERQPACGSALRVRGTRRKEGRERQKPRIPELVLPAVPCGEPYTTIVLVPVCLGCLVFSSNPPAHPDSTISCRLARHPAFSTECLATLSFRMAFAYLCRETSGLRGGAEKSHSKTRERESTSRKRGRKEESERQEPGESGETELAGNAGEEAILFCAQKLLVDRPPLERFILPPAAREDQRFLRGTASDGDCGGGIRTCLSSPACMRSCGSPTSDDAGDIPSSSSCSSCLASASSACSSRASSSSHCKSRPSSSAPASSLRPSPSSDPSPRASSSSSCPACSCGLSSCLSTDSPGSRTSPSGVPDKFKRSSAYSGKPPPSKKRRLLPAAQLASPTCTLKGQVYRCPLERKHSLPTPSVFLEKDGSLSSSALRILSRLHVKYVPSEDPHKVTSGSSGFVRTASFSASVKSGQLGGRASPPQTKTGLNPLISLLCCLPLLEPSSRPSCFFFLSPSALLTPSSSRASSSSSSKPPYPSDRVRPGGLTGDAFKLSRLQLLYDSLPLCCQPLACSSSSVSRFSSLDQSFGVPSASPAFVPINTWAFFLSLLATVTSSPLPCVSPSSVSPSSSSFESSDGFSSLSRSASPRFKRALVFVFEFIPTLCCSACCEADHAESLRRRGAEPRANAVECRGSQGSSETSRIENVQREEDAGACRHGAGEGERRTEAKEGEHRLEAGSTEQTRQQGREPESNDDAGMPVSDEQRGDPQRPTGRVEREERRAANENDGFWARICGVENSQFIRVCRERFSRVVMLLPPIPEASHIMGCEEIKGEQSGREETHSQENIEADAEHAWTTWIEQGGRVAELTNPAFDRPF
ncbi:hypothetical protein TGMAS_273610 [Toxoplasma gondii MAS]|uniref:Uncharacterized protein n=1 Tax=Toxoplasma gondii MAS TaxID=943118 RepID=A0A086QWW8_TOXGO|nr:hypothetical protein TGMAS_273610 [Toxoplasma gondii MAS]